MRLAAILACLVGACGGGSDGGGGAGGGGDPLGEEELAGLCDDLCAHAVECGWEPDLADCQQDCGAGTPIFRAGVQREWITCNTAAPCGEPPGEACFLSALAGVESRPVHDEYVANCEQVRTECGIDGVLPDCDASEVTPFSDVYMRSEVLPCFDLACEPMVACIETTVRDSF